MSSKLHRLFSWEHSYFSGKARAYLRYKASTEPDFDFEDVLATQDIVAKIMLPATHSGAVPQLLSPDGEWVQDSSSIFDYIEERFNAKQIAPSAAEAPRQRLVCYLIELLADEWMVVYGFWERWLYSLPGNKRGVYGMAEAEDSQFDHLRHNALQWGAFINPDGTGEERIATGVRFFEERFGLQTPGSKGTYSGLVDMGVNRTTASAWADSNEHILSVLEAHFSAHDFVLGGRPSLADFALMGPLYAHLFNDAVSGFQLRTRFPLVAEWVARTNGTNALNARTYNQHLYSVGEHGELVPRPATSDGGEWLPDDAIPDTLLPLLAVFFDEMWPVLDSSVDRLAAWMDTAEFAAGTGEVPGKTFGATRGFEAAQKGPNFPTKDGVQTTGGPKQQGSGDEATEFDGPLSHAFTLRGATSRRIVFPYQVWMLQRVGAVLDECSGASDTNAASVSALLGRFPNGPTFATDARAGGKARARPLQKVGGLLFDARRGSGGGAFSSSNSAADPDHRQQQRKARL